MAYIPVGITSIVNTVPSSVQVGASIIGLTPVNVTNPNSSVVVLQAIPPSSVYVVNPVSTITVTPPANQSVSGTVQAELLSTNASIITVGGSSGNSSVQLLNGVAAIGSVAVLQGTNPWVVNMPSPSVITYQAAGSVMAVSATVNTGNSSVQLLGGVATIGSVAVLQGTDPWKVNVPTPSFITYQAAGSVMAVSATVNTGNSSVQLLGGVAAIGSVAVLQGTDPWKISMPSPSIVMYQAAGSILAVSGSFSTGNSSVQVLDGTAVIGSIAVLQGTDPWKVNVPTPSLIMYQAAGSVLAVSGSFTSSNTSVTAFQGGTWMPSAIGYLTRNDTLASTLGADGTFGLAARDSAGRTVIKPFVPEDGTIISYNGSVLSTSVTLIQASTAGKRAYITDFWAANSGATTTILQFRENGTSVIGTTIVPTGGGTNSPGLAIPIKTSNANLDLSFTGLSATSILYLTVKGYLAP